MNDSVSITAILANAAMLLLQIAGPALAALIGVGVLWCVKALAGKLHFQMSTAQDAQVIKVVEQGVQAAEEWARSKGGNKPTGSAKADIAFKAVQELLETKTYQEYGEPAIRGLIDAAVNRMRDDKSVVEIPLETKAAQ